MGDDNRLDETARHDRAMTSQERVLFLRQAVERAKAMRAESIRGLFGRMLAWFPLGRLLGWLRRRIAVSRLQQLDDRMLKDIGLHRSEIEAAVAGARPEPRPLDRRLTPVVDCGRARAPAGDHRPTRRDANRAA